MCGGIHMSDIPSFPYELLWGERTVCSIANLTRKDAEEFMRIAPKVPVRTTTQLFALEQANEALNQLRSGKLQGAGVLVNGGIRPGFRFIDRALNTMFSDRAGIPVPSPEGPDVEWVAVHGNCELDSLSAGISSTAQGACANPDVLYFWMRRMRLVQ